MANTRKSDSQAEFYVVKMTFNRVGCVERKTYLFNHYTNEFTPRKAGCPTFSRKRAKEIVNRLNANLPSENWSYRIRYGIVAVDIEVVMG